MRAQNLYQRLLGLFASGGRAAPIGRVIKCLEELNRSTETEFLVAGEKLAELRSAARQITADLATLTELISGGQGHHATRALDHVLENSRAMNEGVEESGRSLASLGEMTSRLRRAFSDIPAIVSVLRNLCTLTRVETARLGGSGLGFGDLAADVIPLSESIQASGSRVLESAERVEAGVRSALSTSERLRVRQGEELLPLMAAVSASIREFASRQQRACDASARQTAECRELCGAIDGVVANVQVHDITRQQIEHVVEALKGVNPADTRAGPILTLQASQLRNSAGAFTGAVQAIECNLEKIAARLGGMAEDTAGLVGGTEGDHDSFFIRMEERFQTILTTMSWCGEAQREIQATQAQVDGVGGSMRQAIDEIRGLELRIQRTAMNASIRSVHIGRAGGPLAVIADEMQRLVATCSCNTEEGAQALFAISSAAAALSGNHDVSAGSRQAEAELRGAMAELQTAAEISYSRISAIADLGGKLATSAGSLRLSFSNAARFAEVVERACTDLEEMAAALPVAAGAAVELNDLSSRYTMQIERDIHERVTDGVAAATEPLGENVELW